MYDFVLFENYLTAPNHYKDVCIIARMLKANGYSVTIADVFDEAITCREPGIEHYIFKKPWSGRIETENISNPLKRFLLNKLNKIKMNRRLTYCIKELCGNTKNIYGGSLYIGMPIGWMRALDQDTNLFLWGLRSFRLVYFRYFPFSIAGVLSRILYPFVMKHKNIKFFVSDELIKLEFEALGIANNRMVIRPERYINQVNLSFSDNHEKLRFLTLGSLRENKRIEIALDALKEYGRSDIEYTIAGRVQSTPPEEYEGVIASHMRDMTTVKRINKRLSDDEYEGLLNECDFFVMCDAKQFSSVTSGTMNEALLHGMPVIVPDYNPYKFIVEKYNVGFTYNPENVEELVECFKEAKQKGKDFFIDGIKEYQESLLFGNVCVAFNNDLRKALNI